MKRVLLTIFPLAAVLSLLSPVACDKGAPGLDALVEASAPGPVATKSATPDPAVPKLPQISITTNDVLIDHEHTDPTSADFASRVYMLVSGNALVSGAVVDLDADRNVKPSIVAGVLGAIKKSNAKGAKIHTGTRDKTTGILEVVFPKPPVSDCSVVGFINKDASISVWSLGGGTGKRFTKGFAGPDMTLGTDAVRRAASSCDSSVWFVSADDAMIWGLVYDLATIARGADDGGASLKPSSVSVLLKAPVPGQKVAIE
jgi:hypothetical protein